MSYSTVLFNTYQALVSAGQLLGSKVTKPLFTTSKISDFAGRSPFVSVFGALVTGTRLNNINIPFIRGTGLGGLTEYLRSVKEVTGVTNATGQVTHANEVLYTESGTGIADYEFISKATNRYITGHGNEVFHTMIFESAEAGVDNGIGYGRKDTDFIGFGYNGLVFGIWLILRGVRTHIPQDDWNTNKLKSGKFILDPTKENISGTAFGWLGVADIIFYIQASENDWIVVHRHRTANIDNKPHLSDPNQPISTFVERLSGSGANIRTGTSSWYAGTVGNRGKGTGSDKAPLIERDGVTIPSNTETVLLSIRNRDIFQGKPNSIRSRYGTLTLVTDGNKSVKFKVYLNGVTGGTWDFYDEPLSVTEVSTTTSLNLTSTTVGGILKINEQVGSTALGKADSVRLNLFDSDVVIAAYPNDTITITAQSQNTSEIDIQLRLIEEF